MYIERRKFITGLTGVFCAPAIIKMAGIMPINMAMTEPFLNGWGNVATIIFKAYQDGALQDIVFYDTQSKPVPEKQLGHEARLYRQKHWREDAYLKPRDAFDPLHTRDVRSIGFERGVRTGFRRETWIAGTVLPTITEKT